MHRQPERSSLVRAEDPDPEPFDEVTVRIMSGGVQGGELGQAGLGIGRSSRFRTACWAAKTPPSVCEYVSLARDELTTPWRTSLKRSSHPHGP